MADEHGTRQQQRSGLSCATADCCDIYDPSVRDQAALRERLLK